MEGSLYRRLFKDAWRITWKYKPLWVLGFFTVFWGDVGAYQALNNVFDNIYHGSIRVSAFSWPQANLSTGAFAVALLMILVVAGLLAALLIVVVASRGALISELDRSYHGKPALIKAGFRRGLQAFWPLLLVGVITKLDLVLYTLWLNRLADNLNPAAILLYTISFVIITMVSLILSFLGMYASAGIIIKKQTLPESIKASLRLFRNHWLVSIELGLMLYLVTFLMGVAVIVAMFAVAIPMFLVQIILGFLKLSLTASVIWKIGALVGYLALLIAASMFATFQYAVWTLLYLRLVKEGAVSKVMRLTARLPFAHVLHKPIL